MSEVSEKLARVRAYLKRHHIDGVVLGSRANFAWLSGGGDNHVVSQTDGGVGALVVTRRQALVVANRIEIGRLVTEEPLRSFRAMTFPWIGSMAEVLAKIIGKGTFATDGGGRGMKPLPGNFAEEVRVELMPPEIRRYAALGRDCSQVMETVARSLSIGDRESQIEAELARHLLARGIQPYVLLVAFDERIRRFRHPTPTAKRLRRHAMLVVCGQRHGLIASLTRFIHFGPVPADLQARHEAACRVEAAYWEATVIGATWGEAFAAGLARYRAEGFATEWELHHQGGPTGYAGRDIIVTPGEKRRVHDHQAVAWNPSITGAKSEDTYIINGRKRLVVTAASAKWPTITVTTPAGARVKRPAILVR